jgi:hypothetical protein
VKLFIICLNIALILILTTVYFKIIQRNIKQSFFRKSVLNYYKFIISPFILALINAVVLFFYDTSWWYVPFSILIIPLGIIIYEKLRDVTSSNLYNRTYDLFIPRIKHLFQENETQLLDEDIIIEIIRQNKREFIKVKIFMNKNQLTDTFLTKQLEQELSRLINNLEVKVRIIHQEKKSNFTYNLILN